MDEKKIIFEPADPKTRVTSVAHGEYRRDFNGKPPWEATDQEWELFLKRTGAFKQIVRDPTDRSDPTDPTDSKSRSKQ